MGALFLLFYIPNNIIHALFYYDAVLIQESLYNHYIMSKINNEPRFDDLYAQKIADITHIPVSYILQLRDVDILDDYKTRVLLMKHDYFKLYKTGKFSHSQILEKLSGIYGVSPTTINSSIKKRIYISRYCLRCGQKVTKIKYVTNDGLCDKCFAESIKV